MIPSAEIEPERYIGRPLLVVLENYVLDCIGELDHERQEKILAIVQRTFGGDEDWRHTVRNVLHLDPDLDEQLRLMWQQNQKLAKANDTTLHPVQFAKLVADENFAHLIEPISREGHE